jgi:pheromone shutdown protein TraB
MASSGEQFVNAIVEGHKNGAATLVLGDQNCNVTKASSDEAMANTPASTANVPLDLKWRPDESDRENYRRIRNEEMQQVYPMFFQVVPTELDEHIAAKLNKLDAYPNIVAVVMMLHVDGVEESLKSMGWKEE